jgi:hypothetical protein
MPSIGTINPALRRLARTLLLALAGLLILSGGARAFSCTGGKVKEGALCYDKPRDGYSCTATFCVENCRDGYHSTGIGTCHYSGSTTYTQKPYLTRSHSGMQRCLALFYNDCRAGYHMDVCGICSYKGAWDITRKSYDRGPGTNPDVGAAFRAVSATALATWGRALNVMQAAYNTAVQAITALVQDQLYQAAKTVGKTVLAQKTNCNIGQISKAFTQVKANADLRNVMQRIVVAGAKGKVDPQIVLDMQTIASAVGVTANNIFQCSPVPKKWSFGVYGQVMDTAGVGASRTVGIAMNLPLDGHLPTASDVAAFVSVGLVFGPELVDSAEVGLFIAGGDIASIAGPSIGIGMTLDADVGAQVGMGFNIPSRLPTFNSTNLLQAYEDFIAALAPTISLGLGVGEGGGTAVTVGDTATYTLR